LQMYAISLSVKNSLRFERKPSWKADAEACQRLSLR
jgi:hypothetical protein